MTETLWFSFLFTLTRISSMFVTLPFISYRGIPNLLKIFFALTLSYLVFLSFETPAANVEPYTTLAMVLSLGREVLTGLTLGFTVLLVFSVFRMAGQFVDVQMGLSLANLFDPQSGATVTLLSQFYYLFAILIYFAVNGHHYLFIALVRSFELIPPGGSIALSGSAAILVQSFNFLLLTAFQIAAPITATVLITDVSLGLISKTVPQLHVFLVGLPLKIFLGLLVIYLLLPILLPLFTDIFDRLNIIILQVLESMV